MREYGMGKQPYFVYFHRDTENNHVHILTTRVTAKGRLISDHYDYHRFNAALNCVVKETSKMTSDGCLSTALRPRDS